MRWRWVVVAVAATALGAGCSNPSSVSPETLEQLDALNEQNAQTGALDAFADASPEQLACVEDRIEEFDLLSIATEATAQNDEQRRQLLDVVLTCIPDIERLDSYVSTVNGSIELGSGRDLDLSLDEGRCLVRHVLDESDDPARTIALGTGPGDLALFQEGADNCFDEISLAAFFGIDGSGPQRYGDDERLDLLYDDCGSGDPEACDVLYYASSIGSDYERQANECGGQAPTASGYCTAGVQIDPDTGYSVESSAVLDDLAADCEAGELTHCDLLFSLTEPGTDLNRIGSTCAGRLPGGAFPDCRTRFG